MPSLRQSFLIVVALKPCNEAQQAYGQQTAVQSGFNKKNTALDTQAPPEQDHYGEPGMEWDPRDVSRLTRVMRGTFAFG